jgi:hypothetical protein
MQVQNKLFYLNLLTVIYIFFFIVILAQDYTFVLAIIGFSSTVVILAYLAFKEQKILVLLDNLFFIGGMLVALSLGIGLLGGGILSILDLFLFYEGIRSFLQEIFMRSLLSSYGFVIIFIIFTVIRFLLKTYFNRKKSS